MTKFTNVRGCRVQPTDRGLYYSSSRETSALRVITLRGKNFLLYELPAEKGKNVHSTNHSRTSSLESTVCRGKKSTLSLVGVESVSVVVSGSESGSGEAGPLGVFELVYLQIGRSRELARKRRRLWSVDR